MKTMSKGRMFLHVLLWQRMQSAPFKLWGEKNLQSTEPLLRTAAALSRSRCYKVYRNQNIIFLFPLHSSKHLVNKLWSHPRNLVCGRNDRISWSNGARKVVGGSIRWGAGGIRGACQVYIGAFLRDSSEWDVLSPLLSWLILLVR